MVNLDNLTESELDERNKIIADNMIGFTDVLLGCAYEGGLVDLQEFIGISTLDKVATIRYFTEDSNNKLDRIVQLLESMNSILMRKL